MKSSKLFSYCENNTDSDFEEYLPPLKIKKKNNEKRKESSEDTDPSYINTDEFNIENKIKSKSNDVLSHKVKPTENKSKKVKTKKQLKNGPNSNKENVQKLSKSDVYTLQMTKENNNMKSEVISKIENTINPQETIISCEKSDLLAGIPLIKSPASKKPVNNSTSSIISRDTPNFNNQTMSSTKCQIITTNLRIGLSRKQRISKPLHSKF